MKPYQVNLLNAIVLIALGAWGYLGSADPSPTALIPVGFGLVFLLAYAPFKKENKIVAHIVVVLTLLLLIALFTPLTAAINRSDTPATLRVAVMMASSAFALVIYIKSFIDARRKKSS
jgi:4-hydroxybenzoate polyprenyltransferase